MHIVVKATDQQKEEFLQKGVPAEVRVSFFNGEEMIAGADAYFDLCFEEEGLAFGEIKDKPVFVNSVITTSNELSFNCIRINGWNGFLKRDLTELVATDAQIFTDGMLVLDTLNWKYQLVPDVPGMISARVIAMIVNEAYFGLGDGISSKTDIDIAMKLGTNYPFGPFEWSEKIGLHKIYTLLKKLAENDTRYEVAPALEKEIKTN
jgi:3-hydroxybutyryl-CoA dehydrogenase